MSDPKPQNNLKPAGGDELLDTGQEEVFARSEVESGNIEHDAKAGAHPGKADAPVDPEAAARKPPTRQGGADTGQTADDPGRGGD